MVYSNSSEETQEIENQPLMASQPAVANDAPVVLDINSKEAKNYELEKVEDITHEADEEELSLEKKEKELIIKALKKNNNKRKYAAGDLGISERTLYRKIKQYEIDE